MYIKRDLEQVVLNTSKAFPVVLLTGPRQVGKTTMLKRIAEAERKYVTLDNPMVRRAAVNDPALFLERYKPPIIIDEIQYAPELLPYIKMYVDERDETGSIWMTGSQMFHMMRGVSESLAGRVGIIQMQSLSANEILEVSGEPYDCSMESLMRKMDTRKHEDVINLFDRIVKGGMPALYKTDQERDMFFGSYLNTYITRDIRDLTKVGDELAFAQFMTTCAARTGQVVNYSELAKDAGISSPTAKNWLSILVASGIVYLLPPYFNNILKRAIKAPNMYFLDTGLCAYLTRWEEGRNLEVSAMAGAFFETYVVSEIIKSYYNAGKRPPLYYYRDTNQKEIDLIIEKNNVLYPIEIKKSGSPKRNATRHFEVLKKTKKDIGTGNVICLARDLIPLDKDNLLVPEWLI